MIGLDYNKRMENEMGDLPVSYYYIDKMHPSYCAPLHWHRSVEILRVVQGELIINTTGKIITAKSGEIIFINQDTVHGFSIDPECGDCIYEVIDFDLYIIMRHTTLCMDLLHKLSSKKIRFTSFSKSNFVAYSEANTFFNTVSQINNTNSLLIAGALFRFLGVIYKEHLYTKSEDLSEIDFFFKPVLEFISKNYDQNIKLVQLANISNMSVSHFSLKFNETFHQSPIQYLISYRLDKACQMLIETSYTITDIGYKCGFNDSSYFTKKFIKYKNMTPKQYRSINNKLEKIVKQRC